MPSVQVVADGTSLTFGFLFEDIIRYIPEELLEAELHRRQCDMSD